MGKPKKSPSIAITKSCRARVEEANFLNRRGQPTVLWEVPLHPLPSMVLVEARSSGCALCTAFATVSCRCRCGGTRVILALNRLLCVRSVVSLGMQFFKKLGKHLLPLPSISTVHKEQQPKILSKNAV